MKKIPTLFVRGADRRYVTDEVTPGCEWVLAGEGKATRKFDGTCMMLDEGRKWWARREVKPGKSAPENYLLDNVDEVTGKTQGWEPAEQSPFAKFLTEALVACLVRLDPGTYELVGPKINGNRENLDDHFLILHADAEVWPLSSYSISAVKEQVLWMSEMVEAEGLVWHHPDGRMAKLKARDLPAGGRA